jgi:hypothetical protein
MRTPVMKEERTMRRHWPKVLAGLAAVALVAVLVREVPPAIRYIKMERM